jgi:hypothetical protein
LPIRLAPLPGESLDSWLEALARRIGVTLRDIMIALDLPRRTGPGGAMPNLAVYLDDDEAHRLSVAAGVPVATIHAMTLRRYDGQALALRSGYRGTNRGTLWGRAAGSRLCPQCLLEQEGRWLLRWHLTWSMACTRHNCLLAYRCPVCKDRLRSRTSLYYSAKPFRCSLRVRGTTRYCEADLTQAETIPLEPSSPVLAAQRWLDDLLAAIEDEQTGELPVRPVFDDLTTLASWSLRRAQPGDFARYGPRIEQARRGPGKKPKYAPIDTAVLAGPLTRAVEIIRDLEGPHGLEEIRELVGRDASVREEFAPADVIGLARHSTANLQRVMWQAMDAHLDVSERVRYRTCTPRPARPQPYAITAPAPQRVRSVPQLLWRDWAARLIPTQEVRAAPRVRAALSVALLLPGWPLRQFTPLVQMLHGRRRVDLHYFLDKLARLAGVDGLRAICEIAAFLDANPAPIDYERRRTLDGAGLLPTHAWLEICAQTRTHPGSDYHPETMRRFLYQRITGAGPDRLPGALAAPPRSLDAQRLAAVPFMLSAPLLDALDEHARTYLRTHHIDEPVTWSPPASLADGLQLPGGPVAGLTAADVVGVARAQHLPPSGAARALSINMEHLAWLFEQHPPPTSWLRSWRRRPETADPETTPKASAQLISLIQHKRATELLTPEFLEREYLQGRKSVRRIAREAGLGPALVSQALHAAGIPPKHGRHQTVIIDEAWLADQYVNQGRAMKDIAVELEVGQATVQQRLAAQGIAGRAPDKKIICTPAFLESVPSALKPALRSHAGLSRLYRFHASMQHRTLTEASDCLRIGRSVLSTQIKQLETELGFDLYTRPRRAQILQPTTEGHEILSTLEEFSPSCGIRLHEHPN